MWESTISSWGIYVGTSGAGKSLAGGVACTDFSGSTGHHFRFRIADTADRSFVWENSSEVCLMDLEGDTGNLTILGNFALRSNKEFRFYDNGNYVGFEAPALAANQIWVLPSADGSANTTLGTNGDGTLSFLQGILSDPPSGGYRIKKLRLDSNKHIVVVYDETPIP